MRIYRIICEYCGENHKTEIRTHEEKTALIELAIGDRKGKCPDCHREIYQPSISQMVDTEKTKKLDEIIEDA